MELKDGMLVSCKINGKVVEKGKLVKGEYHWHVCQDVVANRCSLADKKGFKYAFPFQKDNDVCGVTDIKPYYTTNIEDVYVGSRIQSKDGTVYVVDAIINNVVFYHRENDAYSNACTTRIEILDYYGCKLIPECSKPEEEVKEMTIRDVEKLVGKKVKIVKE